MLIKIIIIKIIIVEMNIIKIISVHMDVESVESLLYYYGVHDVNPPLNCCNYQLL